MKVVKFLGSALDDLRAFRKAARQDMGRQIERVQRGLEPNDWKPMPSVGRGVREIRIRTESNAYRSLYVTSIAETVYVLHVFVKKSRQTPKKDIELAKSRLKTICEQLER